MYKNFNFCYIFRKDKDFCKVTHHYRFHIDFHTFSIFFFDFPYRNLNIIIIFYMIHIMAMCSTSYVVHFKISTLLLLDKINRLFWVIFGYSFHWIIYLIINLRVGKTFSKFWMIPTLLLFWIGHKISGWRRIILKNVVKHTNSFWINPNFEK